MSLNLFLEIAAFMLSILFLLLLIKEKISCWIFGILASILSIILFFRIGLYSESILHIYYVLIGIYGYRLWKRKGNDKPLEIHTVSSRATLLQIVIGILMATALGYFFANYTDASSPYLDAYTTIFSFIASYLEAKKILSTWKFWIVINATTLLLYYSKDLYVYFFLMLIYLIVSFVGLIRWNRKYRLQLAGSIAK